MQHYVNASWARLQTCLMFSVMNYLLLWQKTFQVVVLQWCTHPHAKLFFRWCTFGKLVGSGPPPSRGAELGLQNPVQKIGHLETKWKFLSTPGRIWNFPQLPDQKSCRRVSSKSVVLCFTRFQVWHPLTKCWAPWFQTGKFVLL